MYLYLEVSEDFRAHSARISVYVLKTEVDHNSREHVIGTSLYPGGPRNRLVVAPLIAFPRS